MLSHSLNVHVFNAYTTNTPTHMHMHTHTLVSQGNGAEEKVFKKRKVFKEGVKELTETE